MLRELSYDKKNWRRKHGEIYIQYILKSFRVRDKIEEDADFGKRTSFRGERVTGYGLRVVSCRLNYDKKFARECGKVATSGGKKVMSFQD